MKIQKTILYLVSLLFLATCTKEVDQFIADPTTFDFMEEIGGDARFESSFTIDGQEFSVITTPQGTDFEFDAGIFEFEDGATCDCPEIDIQIQEFQTAADFILSEMITGDNDLLLATEGQFHVKASSGGKSLKLKDSHKMHFHEPALEDEALTLFYGEGSNPTWTETEDISGSLAHLEYATWDNFAGYEAYVDRLGWINMAHKLPSLQGITSVCVDLDLLTYAQNARIFAIGKEEVFVLPFAFDNDKECFCSYGLPIGLSIEVVAIRKEADESYTYGKQASTVTENLEVHMEYDAQKYDGEEVLDLLRKL